MTNNLKEPTNSRAAEAYTKLDMEISKAFVALTRMDNRLYFTDVDLDDFAHICVLYIAKRMVPLVKDTDIQIVLPLGDYISRLGNARLRKITPKAALTCRDDRPHMSLEAFIQTNSLNPLTLSSAYETYYSQESL